MQQYNKERYDRARKKTREYRVGDLVMIKNVVTEPGINRKLLAHYKGPYEMKKVLDRDRYVIGEIEGFQLTNKKYTGIYGPDRMKLWIREIVERDSNENIDERVDEESE